MTRTISGAIGRLAASVLVAGALALAPGAALAEEAPVEEASQEAVAAEGEAASEEAAEAQPTEAAADESTLEATQGAADIDYASLTNEELRAVIESAVAELAARAESAGGTTSTEVQSADDDAAGEQAPVEEAVEATNEPAEETHTPVTITQSTDKHVQYVKDYVGMNAASFGYTSLGGDRRDSYGGGNVEIIFVTSDGSYVNFDDESTLQQYVVTGQNIAPNTEFHLTFMTNSDGEEYDNLVEYQTLEQIVLSVKPVGSDEAALALTAINVAPDKYTNYIRDYVGRNLAYCGYTSLGGNRMDAYGNAYVQLYLVTEDGSYVDISDEASLQGYVVTGQDIAPNTEFYCTYSTDSEGNECSFTNSQTIEGVTLYVRPIGA